ncbi:MAG: F0F1 ATP synthase subunit gamma [Actinomycetota bacterium]|nr:F0F1 ATP synthase subunit gamma [Actinomycetota bacterium]
MRSTAAIDRQIKAFRLIEDIVNAMKAYAGIVIRKTEDLVANIRIYEESVFASIAGITACHPEIARKIRYSEQSGRILIALGSSQGLCGLFNKKMADAVSKERRSGDALFVIGGKLQSALESMGIVPEYSAGSAVSVNGIQEALGEVLSRVMDIYSQDEFYRLAIIFTSVSGKVPDIMAEQILPPDTARTGALCPLKGPPLLYMDPNIVFEKIIEQLIFITLYRSYAESLRSENWYRLRSMEGASENLRKRLSETEALQRYVRQEEITEEVLDILKSFKT